VSRASRYAVLGIVAASYGLQLQWTQYRTWSFDASSRAIFILARAVATPSRCPVDVQSAWLYEPSQEFYASMLRDPCGVRIETIRESADPPSGDTRADVYVIPPPEHGDATLTLPPIRVIYADPATGVRVAVPDTGRWTTPGEVRATAGAKSGDEQHAGG
jgi:hypothetical protein